MRRVLVLGSPGSGKSTLSLAIANKTDVPVIHLDQYFWKAGWVETEANEWRKKVAALSERESWIMDGNYRSTLDLRLSRANTVILLDVPRLTCLCRVTIRTLQNFGLPGRTRSDMAAGCPERLDLEFFKYVWKFQKTNQQRIFNSLHDFKGPVLILQSKKEIEAYLEGLENIENM